MPNKQQLTTIDLDQLNTVQGGSVPDPDREGGTNDNPLGIGIAGEANPPSGRVGAWRDKHA